jgi:hypothetical protein
MQKFKLNEKNYEYRSRRDVVFCFLPSCALWNVYRACPACPVAPGDGIGVGRNYRAGVKLLSGYM